MGKLELKFCTTTLSKVKLTATQTNPASSFLGLRTASHFGNTSLMACVCLEMEMEGNKLKIKRKKFNKEIH